MCTAIPFLTRRLQVPSSSSCVPLINEGTQHTHTRTPERGYQHAVTGCHRNPSTVPLPLREALTSRWLTNVGLADETTAASWDVSETSTNDPNVHKTRARCCSTPLPSTTLLGCRQARGLKKVKDKTVFSRAPRKSVRLRFAHSTAADSASQLDAQAKTNAFNERSSEASEAGRAGER